MAEIVVTDEAVEAVAHGMFGPGWEYQTPEAQGVCLLLARKSLEAAAPVLQVRGLNREAIADALHEHREGELGCERKDPRQCLYWHEEADRADVVLALLSPEETK